MEYCLLLPWHHSRVEANWPLNFSPLQGDGVPAKPEVCTVKPHVQDNFRLVSHVIGEKALTDEVVRFRAKLLTLQILPQFQPTSLHSRI